MATPTKYEIHPLATIFPEIEGTAFIAFAEDIKTRGQQEPAWLYEGKILDGKNRAKACDRLGLDLKVQEYKGDDPIGFVLSTNLHRRHLDESQRSMVAARLTDLEVGANQHTKGKGTSIDAASKFLNVGRASIDRARKVLGSGNPALIKAVDSGEQSVSNAAASVPNNDSSKTPTTKKPRTPTTPAGKYDKLEEKLIAQLKELDACQVREHADKTIAALNDTVDDIVSIAKRAASTAAKLGAVA